MLRASSLLELIPVIYAQPLLLSKNLFNYSYDYFARSGHGYLLSYITTQNALKFSLLVYY